MLKNILTYKEYKEIVDHCKNCKSSYAIKDFIGDVFREFEKSNTNLVLTLMEYIETNHKSLQGISDLIQNDHLDINEELHFLALPSIEYTYSYLISFLGKPNGLNKSVGYKPELPISKIRTVLKRLKAEKFCEFSDISKVLIKFQENEDSVGEKIKWIDKSARNKQVNYRTLLLLLGNIYEDGIIYSRNQILASEINRLFLKNDGKNFSVDNVKTLATRYKKDLKSNKASSVREILLGKIVGNLR